MFMTICLSSARIATSFGQSRVVCVVPRLAAIASFPNARKIRGGSQPINFGDDLNRASLFTPWSAGERSTLRRRYSEVPLSCSCHYSVEVLARFLAIDVRLLI